MSMKNGSLNYNSFYSRELIVCSAIRFIFDDETYTDVYGVRHPHIYWQVNENNLFSNKRIVKRIEGFVTNEIIDRSLEQLSPTFRFVDRVEAKTIAIKSGQYNKPDFDNYKGDELFSEHLFSNYIKDQKLL